MTYYFAGFSLAEYGSISMVANGNTFTMNAATYASTYSHLSMTTAVGSGYSDFATQLQAALNASGTAGWTVTFNGAYTIAKAASTITFPVNVAGFRAAILLGYSSSKSGASAATHTSIYRPNFMCRSVLDAFSQDTNTYEQGGIMQDGVASDGTVYGVSPVSVPVLRDWTQPLENRLPPAAGTSAGTATRTANNSLDVTMAWEGFFQQVRNRHPFLVSASASSTAGTTAYKLRADGAHFAPIRRQAEYDEYWDIPFKTRVIGTQ